MLSMDEGSVFNQRMFSVEESSVISGGKQCFQWKEVQGSSVFSGRKCREAVFSGEGSAESTVFSEGGSVFSEGRCREAVFSVEGSSIFSRRKCFQWREAVFSVEGSSVFSGGKQFFSVEGSVFSGGKQCFSVQGSAGKCREALFAVEGGSVLQEEKQSFQLREAVLSVQRSSDVLSVHAYPGSGRRLCVTSESGAAGSATRGTSTDPAARQAAASGETSHPVAAARHC